MDALMTLFLSGWFWGMLARRIDARAKDLWISIVKPGMLQCASKSIVGVDCIALTIDGLEPRSSFRLLRRRGRGKTALCTHRIGWLITTSRAINPCIKSAAPARLSALSTGAVYCEQVLSNVILESSSARSRKHPASARRLEPFFPEASPARGT